MPYNRPLTITAIVEKHWIALFCLLPFLPVLREMYPVVSFKEYTLMGFSKDIVLLSLLVCLCLVLLYRSAHKIVAMSSGIYLISVFSIWGLLHAFVGLQRIEQGLSGVRFQVAYSVMAGIVLICHRNGHVKLIDFINRLPKYFLIQAFIVLGVAYYEIYDPGILTTLYGDRYSLITRNLGIPGHPNIRIVSVLGNPINLGLYLTVAFIFVLMYGDVRGKRPLYYLGATGLFLVPTMLTFSRISFAIFFVTVTLFCCYKVLNSPVRVGALLCALIVFAIGFSAYWVENVRGTLVAYRTEQLLSMSYVSNDPRVANSAEFLSMVFGEGWLFSLWGGGLGLSNPAEYAKDAFQAESSYVTVLAEQGIVGLAMFTIILVKYALNVISVMRTSINPLHRKISFYFLLVFVWFALGSVASDTIRNSPFSFYFWLFYVLSEALRWESEKYWRMKLSYS